MSSRAWNRSTPAIRSAIRATSTCRARPRRSATSAAWPTSFEGTVIPVEAGFLNYMTREPVGVVGQVVPWNFPLMFTSWKMAPALAAGNCVVMKPAELTPLSSLAIAELMAEVGFPAGVVNVLPGLGHIAGQYIAEHPGISKVAFTGSTAVGRKIVQASSGNLKKVQLELGGKGANVVFSDANIDAVVQGSAFGIFHNQGQACIAASRLIVHRIHCRRTARTFHRACPLDKNWRPARSIDGDGTAHLADASRPRAVVCRCSARARRSRAVGR